MKGALSARRRKESLSKNSAQARKKQGNGVRSDLSGGLSEASFVLSEVEAKVGLLTRKRSLGAPAILTESSTEALPISRTSERGSLSSNSPSPSESTIHTGSKKNIVAYGEDDESNPNFLAVAPRLSPAYQRWENFSSSLLKRGYWSRLGDLARTLNTLPEDIRTIFVTMEQKHDIRLDEGTKLQYYKDFTRTALGATMLHVDEVARAAPFRASVPEIVPASLL
jgi:hypothetical protein